MSIWNETLIRARLDYDDRWVCRALMVLYSRQTQDEKSDQTAKHTNGMGFSAADAPFFTRLAEWYRDKGWLSKKQIAALRRDDIGKYWKQILEVIQANERMKENEGSNK